MCARRCDIAIRIGNLALHVGAGAELIQGVSSADWRAHAGVNYTFGPIWGKPKKSVLQPIAAAPQPPAPEPVTPSVEKFVIGSILFETDSATLKGDYEKTLETLVAELKRSPLNLLIIEGLKLSRIRTEEYGPSRPIQSNGNYQGRQANRRVEFTIER